MQSLPIAAARIRVKSWHDSQLVHERLIRQQQEEYDAMARRQYPHPCPDWPRLSPLTSATSRDHGLPPRLMVALLAAIRFELLDAPSLGTPHCTTALEA